jgi:predicted double-glycine peptidase
MLLALLALAALARPAHAGRLRVSAGPQGGEVAIRREVKSVQELQREDVVIQQLDYSCGSASLSTIFSSYFSEPLSEREIIESILAHGDLRSIIARRGFSLYDLKQFAEEKGAKAEGYQMDFEALSGLDDPVIVPMKLTGKLADRLHFVVFRGLQDGRVLLADPGLGRRALSIEQFERQWSPPVGLVVSKPGLDVSQSPLSPQTSDEPHVAADTARNLTLWRAPDIRLPGQP